MISKGAKHGDFSFYAEGFQNCIYLFAIDRKTIEFQKRENVKNLY